MMTERLKQRRPNSRTPEHQQDSTARKENHHPHYDEKSSRLLMIRSPLQIKTTHLFGIVLLFVAITVVIYTRDIWIGSPGSIRGGLIGRLVDSTMRRRILTMRLNQRKQILLDLNLQLPASSQLVNQRGIVNLPQSTVEQILVRSASRNMEQKMALNRATEWKKNGCKGSDSAIPDQILQPNYGSWFRPLVGRNDIKRLQFSDDESYQLIKQDFPMILPMYKRTLETDARILIWSVCAIYQYGGYFLGNSTRLVDAEIRKIYDKPPSSCSDFGIAFLSSTSLTLLAASPRHPQLELAIQKFERAKWDQELSIPSFLNFTFENLKSTTEFRIYADSPAPDDIHPQQRVEVVISEVVDAPKTQKTIKNSLNDQLINAGCIAGWLCNRCLRLSFRGSYSTCKSFCNSCFENIICDRKETAAMNTITLEVKRQGPNRHLIPRIIHQTFSEDLSTDRYLQLVRFQNTWKSSGWEYRFYDDNDIRNYLIKNFPPRVMDAFDAVKQGAFKADLFRYLVLTREGGIYVDIDVVLDTNLDLFVPPNLSFFAPIDIVCDYAAPGSFCLWNGLIGSAPGHPIVAKAVEKSLTNILNRADYYDIERTICHLSNGSAEIWKLRLLPILSITGPCLLGIAMNEVLRREPLDNFEAGWVFNSMDPGAVGDVLLLQASKGDMGAFRFTDVDRGVVVASTNMEGMLPTDKDAFDADILEIPKETKSEVNHYSKAEIGVDIFGSERVYIDKFVANEVISLLLM